jgi:acyl-CoA thioester hydrolase
MTAHAPPLTLRTDPLDPTPYDIAHPRPFLCDITVGRQQLSRAVDHVSNIEYLRWFDRAAELHSDSWGDTRPELLKRGVMWFVARHEIDYQAETGLDEQLILATWVRDVARVKSWRDSLLVRPADETIVARCASLWVYVDLERRKPTRIDDALAARLDPAIRRTSRGTSCTSS